MTATDLADSKGRPFPWVCANCFTPAVVPVVTDYTTKIKHDGTIHQLHLSALEIPRCQKCGETIVTSAVDERINDALRAQLRLLTPAQIHAGIQRLRLSDTEVAERLGIAPETLSHWINGGLIQSRAMDNLLRSFFAFPEVRNALRGANQDPHFGVDARVALGNETT